MPKKYLLTRPVRPIDRPGQVRPTAQVWIESEEYTDDGALRVEGDEGLVEKIRHALFMSYGSRGRPLQDEFSPMDLAVALDSKFMEPFEPAELP